VLKPIVPLAASRTERVARSHPAAGIDQSWKMYDAISRAPLPARKGVNASKFGPAIHSREPAASPFTSAGVESAESRGFKTG
jgi:hypothetical protein